MADKGPIIRNVIMWGLLGATALGIFNVFSDNSEVEGMAQGEACAHKQCKAQRTQMMKGPIGQSYTFQVEITEPAKGTQHSVDVDCRRTYYLLGEYQCKRKND